MKHLYIFLFAIIVNFSNAQAPNWLWAQGFGQVNQGDYGRGLCIDPSGNIVTTGNFNSPSLVLGTNTLTNSFSGVEDMFVAKYGPTGNIIWAKKSTGSTDIDRGSSICSDASGNTYVGGHFQGASIGLGSTLNNTGAVGTADMFITKLDASGNFLWARKGGGINSDGCSAVACDPSGNVYVTGMFQGPAAYFGTYTLTTNGWYIAKYNSSGTIQWAKDVPASVRSMAADGSGNLYMAGDFLASSITLGSTTLNNTNSFSEVFLAKMDGTTGNYIWAKSGSGDRDDFCEDIVLDGSGNVFVTGNYDGNSITIGSSVLANALNGTDDFFAAKYDSNGNPLWGRRIGGTASDRGQTLSTDAVGNVYVGGYYYNSSITIGTTTLTNSGSTTYANPFVVKYDPSGSVLWAKQASGLYNDIFYGIGVDAAGNIYVNGYSNSTSCSFSPYTVTGAGPANTADMIIAKIDAGGVGIEDLSSDNVQIHIYPNPTNGKFTVMTSGKDTILSIYNVLGEVISKIVLEEERMEIDLSKEASGIYFIRIGNQTKRIIKE